MKRLNVHISASVDLDDDAYATFEKIRAEFPGEEQDWLNDRINDGQGCQVQHYDLEYTE